MGLVLVVEPQTEQRSLFKHWSQQLKKPTIEAVGVHRDGQSWCWPVFIDGQIGQGSFLEDIIFTIIMFRLIEEFAGTAVAYIAISLLFGWMHLWNDNSTYMTSLYIAIQEVTILAPFILTRRLWMTWAVHFGWNYAQTRVF